ncbi:ArnT family glycosyltransferase [Olivibacter domesticus]|uniref:4-amino-4-deoxy-L-arabinose transferase n=1 Tax=Olivibacter domesticus TaxID=407022 RepID=A0A1H7QL42_OLID1|nr:glycosyltransferase family 39 protein [Olivibacter domesticus]SEL47977.1 4-amino-4-deoxy-L-arabinose transferase [Olivibacter domesticus]
MKISANNIGKQEEKQYFLLILLIMFVSAFSIFGGIMEPDGALYASIAKNMVLNADWANLYVRGQDWLDKPHLTFWLASFSFELLGINGLAYKLPSLLIGWIGCYYLYLLTSTFYDRKTGLIATLIYMTAFHVAISNFDVRAEIYLSTFTIASTYHYYRAYESSAAHIIAGSFFLACAVMVKGIFVVIPVLGSFICYWLFSKQYKEFFKIKWWSAFALIGVFIVPELYTLYIQFDMHPEKFVFDRQQVSGIQFFFWDSQFGRFFNTGPIKGKGDISFFLHTILWAFLPWCIVFYIAIVNNLTNWKKNKEKSSVLIISMSALIAFLLFSLSKFQLPHYIIIIFPHFAIITASYLKDIDKGMLKTLSIVQHVIFSIVTILLILIALVFNFPHKVLSIALSVGIAILAYMLFFNTSLKNLIFRSAFLSITFMVFAYGFFYPALLRYQAGMSAGVWLKKYEPHRQVIAYKASSFALDFYAPGEVKYADNLSTLSQGKLYSTLFFIQEEELTALKENFKVKVLRRFDHYHITKLTLNFLNHKTRPSSLSTFYLVEIQ